MNATVTEVVDDGRRPDRPGRVRTPRERREELLGEYERGGLSQAAFARRAGVRNPTPLVVTLPDTSAFKTDLGFKIETK